MIRCVAFDCFGTVFDASSLSRDDVRAYVEHVRRDDFSEFDFPRPWWSLEAHRDSAEGIRRIRNGFVCVALSNGSKPLIQHLSDRAGISWDAIYDPFVNKAYKPHNLDAYRWVERQIGFKPSETLMITANPTFGDIEGAEAIGMRSQVIRHGRPETIIELAEMLMAEIRE